MKSKFNFYNVYLNELNKLNPFQFKKVVNALSDYAKDETIPMNLSNKGMAVFNKIQTVIIAEKMQLQNVEKKRIAGKKGAKKRWNSTNMAKK